MSVSVCLCVCVSVCLCSVFCVCLFVCLFVSVCASLSLLSSADDTVTGKKIAIKKIPNAFNDLTDAKRILREIKLMRHFDHENVSGWGDELERRCVLTASLVLNHNNNGNHDHDHDHDHNHICTDHWRRGFAAP